MELSSAKKVASAPSLDLRIECRTLMLPEVRFSHFQHFNEFSFMTPHACEVPFYGGINAAGEFYDAAHSLEDRREEFNEGHSEFNESCHC